MLLYAEEIAVCEAVGKEAEAVAHETVDVGADCRRESGLAPTLTDICIEI
jgi:hypothetical protein